MVLPNAVRSPKGIMIKICAIRINRRIVRLFSSAQNCRNLMSSDFIVGVMMVQKKIEMLKVKNANHTITFTLCFHSTILQTIYNPVKALRRL